MVWRQPYLRLSRKMRPSGKIIIAIAVLLAPLFASARNVDYPAGSLLTKVQIKMLGVDGFFWSSPLTDELFARIDGGSYGRGCTTPREELAYLHVLHRNFAGQSQVGEMVCAKSVAAELLAIFRELYDKGYPIEKMFLVDEYGASDERSMADNNSSCFNYRSRPGMKTLSLHARGLAVDINPLYNPYVKGSRIEPAAGSRYADRSLACRYYISKNDLCYKVFVRHGWSWGGAWRSAQDYQHFEKTK